MTSLRDYQDAYVECRRLGHAWVPDERTRKRSGGIGSVVEVLGCTRCNMTRIDSYRFNGELLTRTYRRPDGYKLSFRPLVADLRKARFARDRRRA